jgi:hypothetical protein
MSSREIVYAAAGASGPANYIEDVFSTYLYTGNGAARSITNDIDLAGKGGLTWIKARTQPSFASDNVLFDTSRGALKYIRSNTTAAEFSSTGSLTSFNNNGFSLGADSTNGQVNWSGHTYCSWTFREQPKFFDVVTYTGNGSSSRQIAHNLGSVPGMIIVKNLDFSTDWVVIASDGAGNYYMGSTSVGPFSLNTTARANENVSAASADVTSTYFNAAKLQINSGSTFDETAGNGSGSRYVAYVFASNASGFGTTGTDNVISCGSFTTNASGSATINLGYEPQMVMVKGASTTSNWFMFDNMRGWSLTNALSLSANRVNAETNQGANLMFPTATGFQVGSGSTSFLAGSETFIYMAIRRPMKVPTVGTSVFSPNIATLAGSANTVTTNFPVDLAIPFYRDGFYANWFDRLRGDSQSSGVRLRSASTDAEVTTPAGLGFDNNTGYIDNYDRTYVSGTGNYVYWNLRRASRFFDVVSWGGSASSVNHNLGVAPELLIYKTRSQAGSWNIYCSALSNPLDNFLRLETTAAATNIGVPLFQNMTSTTFGITSAMDYGATANVAYLFATCAGVSKVGSYTGNGGTQAIACGFTGGARFVMIKRTDSTSDWFVYDTARGMTTVTNPYLPMNGVTEVATLGSVTTTTGGFTVDASILAAINTNGASYIFLAIA